MLSTVSSAGLMGITAYSLTVEVDISFSSMPHWNTVGLPESEVKESKERVIAAIRNSGYDFAQRKITVNLAPADVKKEGTALDLPMALGLLGASGLIQNQHLQDYLCVGELSLNGDLRPVPGVLPMAMLAQEKKAKGLLLPRANAAEAAIVQGVDVYGVSSLAEAVEFIEGRLSLAPYQDQSPAPETVSSSSLDFEDICGQYQAKRALEVAACGGHNILFIGSPGAGKTMLASRLPTILPFLHFRESLETSRVYSVVNLLPAGRGLLKERPFRSPHHSVSDAGLIGGGTIPRPGEVSMAHNGVLFLDELPEFKKNVLELLRQPLEAGEVTITRAAMSLTFPARFMMVSAMNPCPCGYYGHPRLPCVCTPSQIQRYRNRLSGPLLDRIDLQIEVPPVKFDELTSSSGPREKSQEIRKRVLEIRTVQHKRFEKEGLLLNAQMGTQQLKKYCTLNTEGKQLLRSIVDKFHLSARAYTRILKVARTLADMSGSEPILTQHLLEAVQYRSLDRNLFG